MNRSDSDNLKKYKCLEKDCNASYTKKCRLEVHIRKHTEERPFVCDVEACVKSYTNLPHLQRHKRLFHEKACEVICSEKDCGRVFNNKYSLTKHLTQYHDTRNLLKCTYCPEVFRQKRLFKKHLDIHEGRAALICSYCNITFESVYLHNKHRRNHKTYTCVCGSVFIRWGAFCQHKRESCRIKIDYKCIICNKEFASKTNLRIHSRIHLEESQIEVYSCHYVGCSRTYRYKKNLNYHIAAFHERKNDGIRINCTVKECNGVFKSMKNLKQHLQNIHIGLINKEKSCPPRQVEGEIKTCVAFPCFFTIETMVVDD